MYSMLQKPHGMWLCSAGLSNPTQLLQFLLPEVSHLETEFYMSPYAPTISPKIETKNWKVKSKKASVKKFNSNGNELYFFTIIILVLSQISVHQ